MISVSTKISELELASELLPDGNRAITLSVPGIHCGGCIQKIENFLLEQHHIVSARVNLTLKQVNIAWEEDSATPDFYRLLSSIGFEARIAEERQDDGKETQKRLVRALAAAGFAAGNIMMLSVAVWSGAAGETRDLLHQISAVIAAPAVIYAGIPFFGSAWRALSKKTTNMDVPISIGVIITFLMSLHDTIVGGEHAYFDAVTMLLFFLLVGRVLDHSIREKAKNSISGLQKLVPRVAAIENGVGNFVNSPVETIEPGMNILVRAGECAPVDGTVVSGISEVDTSIINGENHPRLVKENDSVVAGTMNLTGPIVITATSNTTDSFVAQMINLVSAAEDGRQGYRKLADRLAQIYSPFVHTAALLAFLTWYFSTGDTQSALTVAVSVLIITCPCALGLAVPMVQVAATQRLMKLGILTKDGTALERLCDVDHVVLDKTGTLTLGKPHLVNAESIDPDYLSIAGSLGSYSKHPFSQALARTAMEKKGKALAAENAEDVPGFGVSGEVEGVAYRLGRASWALETPCQKQGTVLSGNGQFLVAFEFADIERPDIGEFFKEMARMHMPVEVVSGDSFINVQAIAQKYRVSAAQGDQTPKQKVDHIEWLITQGKKPLMVGDGLNDLAAQVAAHVSIAPANAVDLNQRSADLISLGHGLKPIVQAIEVARRSDVLVKQNFGIALAYNIVAVPFAFAGYVTPLYAAIAMSLSSIMVVLNALRINGWPKLVDRSQTRNSDDQSRKYGEVL